MHLETTSEGDTLLYISAIFDITPFCEYMLCCLLLPPMARQLLKWLRAHAATGLDGMQRQWEIWFGSDAIASALATRALSALMHCMGAGCMAGHGPPCKTPVLPQGVPTQRNGACLHLDAPAPTCLRSRACTHACTRARRHTRTHARARAQTPGRARYNTHGHNTHSFKTQRQTHVHTQTAHAPTQHCSPHAAAQSQPLLASCTYAHDSIQPFIAVNIH